MEQKNKALGRGLEQLFASEVLDFDSFESNILDSADENDVKENQTVEIIESGNENEDFSTQEDDNDEVFDEKTFDFSQFGDLPGLNETLCEDDEEF